MDKVQRIERHIRVHPRPDACRIDAKLRINADRIPLAMRPAGAGMPVIIPQLLDIYQLQCLTGFLSSARAL